MEKVLWGTPTCPPWLGMTVEPLALCHQRVGPSMKVFGGLHPTPGTGIPIPKLTTAEPLWK